MWGRLRRREDKRSEAIVQALSALEKSRSRFGLLRTIILVITILGSLLFWLLRRRARETATTAPEESVEVTPPSPATATAPTEATGAEYTLPMEELPPDEERPKRGTSEVQRTSIETPSKGQTSTEAPLEGYDSLTVKQVSERLDELSAEEIRQLRAYEAENKNRSTLLRRLDERIEADFSS
jgi:type IV secretory pathway VirB10-like protein